MTSAEGGERRRDEHGDGAARLHEMALHPGTNRKYAVSPQWNRARPGIILPTASCQPHPGHGAAA